MLYFKIGQLLYIAKDIIKNITFLLKSLKGDTSALPEIKDMLGSFVGVQREHNKEQRDFNQEMREHNKRLEKILEKLAEK